MLKGILLVFVFLVGVAQANAQLKTLWSLGESNDESSEFALAPDGYGDFLKNDFGWEDRFFVVGFSKLQSDFPYVLPGSADYWGGTSSLTADWGDVQPEHGRGVDLDENTHRSVDIYDNAMFIIALDNLMELLPKTKMKWFPVREQIAENSKKLLWDTQNQKFIPHLYLEEGSPFPDDFDEKEIYYFGGTAIAIEAGLLTREEVKISIDEMIRLLKVAGAPSIGLTLYPTYPEGFFKNPIMAPVYHYQNGGDWTWFGGRMIQQLVQYGFVEEAYEQLLPMTSRVIENDGFFEWHTVDNKPKGSGTFRGEAGVLFVAIQMLEEWAAEQ